MKDQNEKKYKQLALFSVIVAEVVVTPTILGAVFYWLFKNTPYQKALSAVGALFGLGIAFYRIYQLHRKQMKDE